MNPLHLHVPAALAPVLGVGLFVAFWIALMRLMRRLARMTDRLPPDAGPLLRRSRAGNATINGARAKNCVRIYEYANGHAVRMSRIFGGGMVWLPRGATAIHAPDADTCELRHQDHRIVLSGRLAAFMGAAPAAAPAAAWPTPQGTAGRHPARSRTGGSALGRIGLVVAFTLLAFVVVRRAAPELLAPLEHLIADFFPRP